jgi:hypothetical protein
MKKTLGTMDWVKDLPKWIMGFVAFITAIFSFVKLLQGNYYLGVTVLGILLLVSLFLLFIYLSFSKIQYAIMPSKWRFRYEKYRPWTIVGSVFVVVLFILIWVIKPSRSFVVTAFVGTATSTSSPTPTATPSATSTPTGTASPTYPPTASPTVTLTQTPTLTHTPTHTPTRTKTLLPSPTETATPTPFEIVGNFQPSLHMGDMGDVQVIAANLQDCQGKCFEVIFTPLGKGNAEGFHTCSKGIISEQLCQWTGIYWVYPPGNDGWMGYENSKCTAGYDLSGYSSLHLRARAAVGNLTVSFLTGGVGKVVATPPPCPDSFYLSPIVKTLTTDWVEISLNISNRDRSYLIGGLGITMAWLDNGISTPDNTPRRIYLDNIRFEP